MAQKPIAMEQLKQVLQLKKDDVLIREIARRVGISRNSVRKYLSRVKENPSDADLAVFFQVFEFLEAFECFFISF
jgi:response regulator of citrate/malate metabolism